MFMAGGVTIGITVGHKSITLFILVMYYMVPESFSDTGSDKEKSRRRKIQLIYPVLRRIGYL